MPTLKYTPQIRQATCTAVGRIIGVTNVLNVILMYLPTSLARAVEVASHIDPSIDQSSLSILYSRSAIPSVFHYHEPGNDVTRNPPRLAGALRLAPVVYYSLIPVPGTGYL